MRRIEFYRTSDGKCPIEDFFDSLDSRQIQKVAWTLRLIKELEIIPKQYIKKLEGTNDIWEIRVLAFGINIRLLCFQEKGNLIILTHGFIKKQSKVPKAEINKAEKYKKEYLGRFHEKR
jgi:phage-related protein